jgi:hypothetical protein
LEKYPERFLIPDRSPDPKSGSLYPEEMVPEPDQGINPTKLIPFVA